MTSLAQLLKVCSTASPSWRPYQWVKVMVAGSFHGQPPCYEFSD